MGDDDSETVDFELTIPEDADSGKYFFYGYFKYGLW